MFSTLPNEIIHYIIKINAGLNDGYHQYMDVDVREVLKLRNVNTNFRELIDNIDNLWDFKNNMKGLPIVYYNRIYREKTLLWNDYHYKSRLSIDEQVTDICKKNTSKESIEWLFKNNIFLSLKNLKNLINYNRIDSIKMALHYEKNREIIFNRFHFGEITDKHDDILSNKETLHPLIIAGNKGRVEIVDLLLNSKPEYFHKEIPNLLDISIKYNHEKLLTYLVINHYDKICNVLKNKVPAIINRVDNCQGLLFYLMNGGKITVSQKLLIGCISKSYTDLFRFCYDKFNYHGVNDEDLIKQCLHYNDIDILNYLIIDNKCKVCPIKFSSYFLKKRTYTGKFISNIVNHHKEYLKKESQICNIIHLSIKYEINDLLVKDLIFNDYHYTNEHIKMAIDLSKYSLVEYMCQKIKNKK